MSHKAIVRVEIRNPVRSILRDAVFSLAHELGAEAREGGVVEGWAFRENVDFLIEIPTSYGNGFGVRIDDSIVRVVADVHDDLDYELLEKVKKGLTQWYIAIAAKRSLQELGYYNVTIERQGDEFVIVAQEGVTGW